MLRVSVAGFMTFDWFARPDDAPRPWHTSLVSVSVHASFDLVYIHFLPPSQHRTTGIGT